MSGGRRCTEEDGFRFVWVEAKAVEQKPATDCCRAWGKVVGVARVVVVECDVELRVIGILMVTDVECRDYVGDWGNVEREQDGPQNGSLRYTMYAGRWW